MYKSPKVSLIHQDKISQAFLTTIGLKQSDILSTILFNIYINDLPRQLLEDSRSSNIISDIPYQDDTKINNLLFADDLAIFSLSKEDLQKRISTLEQYSNEWGLELNLSKTKIMIFNKQGATKEIQILLSRTRNQNSETVYISRIYIHTIWKKTPRN